MADTISYPTSAPGSNFTNYSLAIDFDGDVHDLTTAAYSAGDDEVLGMGWPSGSPEFGDIPAGSTIDGIQVAIHCSGGGSDDYLSVRLFRNTGSTYSDAKTQIPPSSKDWRYLGGATDLWGLTWSLADLQSSMFAAYLTHIQVTKVETLGVWGGYIRVYYTTAAGETYARTCTLGITVTDNLKKNLRKRLAQGITVTDNLAKNLRKRLTDAWKIVAETTASLWILTVSLTESFRVTDTMRAMGRYWTSDMETLRSGKLQNFHYDSTLDGTIVGTTSISDEGARMKSCFFGGVAGNYVSIPAVAGKLIRAASWWSLVESDDSVTARGFVYQGTTAGYRFQIDNGPNTSPNDDYIRVTSGDGLSAGWYHMLNFGCWQHFLVNIDWENDRAQLFVDGVDKGWKVLTISPTSSALAPVVGRATATVNGYMDEVTLYTGLLGQEEVTRLREFGWYKLRNEELSITDYVSKRFAKGLRETGTFVATVIASVGILSQTLTQALAVSDTLYRQVLFVRSFTQGATLSATTRFVFKKALAQALALTDTLKRYTLFERTFTQGATFSDTLKKTFAKTLGLSHLYGLWDGLVLAYDGETVALGGGKTWRDVSRNTDYYKCTLQLNGSVGSETGKYGQATYINGRVWNDYGTVENSDEINVTDEITVMAWAKIVDADGYNGLVVKMYGSTDYCWCLWTTTSGFSYKPAFSNTLVGATGRTAQWPNGITGDEYHMLVGTYSKSEGKIKISVDGEDFVSTDTANASMRSSTDFIQIGVQNLSTGDYFTGDLDDIVIWSKALSIEEVRLLYNSWKGLNLNDLTDSKPFWGFGLTDTLAKRADKRMSEMLSVADTLSKWAYYARSIVQGAVFTATVRASGRLAVLVTQALALTDTLIRRTLFARSFAQAIVLTDTLSKRFARSIAQGLTVTDTLSKWSYSVRSFAQGLSVTDTLSKWSYTIRSLATQGLRVMDTLSRRATFARSLTQGLTVSGTLSRWVRYARTFTQGLTVAATVGYASRLVRSLTQGITFAETLLKRVLFARTYTQGVTVTDTTSRRSAFVRTFTQALAVTATGRFLAGCSVRLTQAVALAETLLWRTLFIRRLTQGFTIADTLSKRMTFPRTFTQGLTLSGTLSKRATFARAFTQGLRVTDTLRWVSKTVRSLTQGIAVAETLKKTFAKRVPTHGLTFADTFSRVHRMVRSFTQGLTLTATVSWASRMARTLSETLSISDTLSRTVVFARSLAQGLRVTDTFNGFAGSRWYRQFVENLTYNIWVSRYSSGVFIKLTEQCALAITIARRAFDMRLTHALAVVATTSSYRHIPRSITQGITFLDTLAHRAWFSYAMTQGMVLEATVELTGRFWARVTQGLTVSADPSTVISMLRSVSQGITVAADVAWRSAFTLALEQALAVQDTVRTLADLLRSLTQGLSISDSLSIVRDFYRRFTQGIQVTETLATTQYIVRALTQGITYSISILRTVNAQILALTEGFTLADEFLKTIGKRLTQALTLEDINITDVVFEILSVTPLAGTFPRPARIATFTLKVSRSDDTPLSGAAVEVTIYKPNGDIYKILDLEESAYEPGLYSYNFKISGADPLGSYPFDASATYGLSSGTYSGFITIFQGPLAGIHYR